MQSGNGGLSGPRGLAFGPDGNLYVAGSWSDGVYVYQGPSGAAPGQFIMQLDSDGTGQIDFPAGLVFGPDNQLYVSSNSTHQVLRYNGSTGDFIDDYVHRNDGGLYFPVGVIVNGDVNADGKQDPRWRQLLQSRFRGRCDVDGCR